MIPGPYAISHVTFDDSDGGIYRTLSWGYDDAVSAFNALAVVAANAGVPEQECAVTRFIDREEMERFSD